MQTLRLFYDVARCHSFSRAAELHGLTQSAVSQRVGQLEKRLGTTLIDRSVRPLELTDAGEIFLTGIEDVLARYDALERRVTQLGEGEQAAIRVGAIYSSGIDLLGRLREAYLADHPRARRLRLSSDARRRRRAPAIGDDLRRRACRPRGSGPAPQAASAARGGRHSSPSRAASAPRPRRGARRGAGRGSGRR